MLRKSLSFSVALVALVATAAQAQTYNTMPFGSGYTTTGPNGTYTTMPFGNGYSTTGPNGYNSTTMPFGSGYSTYVSPGFQQQPVRPFGYR